MIGLCVRFTCKDQASAEAYDRLVAETVEGIKVHEPGTLIYAVHEVQGQPLQGRARETQVAGAQNSENEERALHGR